MKDYIIVLNKNIDKEIFKLDLQNVSVLDFVPDRECEIVDIKDSRCIITKLSEEEAKSLVNDSRISKLQINKPTTLEPYFTTNTFSSGNFLLKQPFFKDNYTTNIKNIEEKSFELKTQALSASAAIEEIPDGSGVDVVIVDGLIMGLPVNQRPCPSVLSSSLLTADNIIVHPELRDDSGNSRVELVNWNSYVEEPNNYPYSGILADNNEFQNNIHGLHVAGTLCGKTLGWAKKSKIYNISPYTGPLIQNYSFLTAIKNWHLAKTNNRPTITNHSYGINDPIYDIRYINKITVSGVSYEAPRETEIAIVQANVNLTTRKIESFNIINGGSGYTNKPTLSFNGGGGDEADLVMASGTIKEIFVTNIGSGYDQNSPPSIVFSASENGITASGICSINSNGSVDSIIMTEWGNGYTNAPTVTFDDPISGTTATALTTIGSNFVKGITILNSAPYIGRSIAAASVYDPPFLIISNGGCTKEALWTFTNNANIKARWYGTFDGSSEDFSEQGGTIFNGLYEIASKKTIINNTSFKYTLLGGEYISKPNVSFSYQMPNYAPMQGPHADILIENGSVTNIINSYWFNDFDGGAGLEYKGWFTSNPQVFLTNGGGFTEQHINGLDIPTITVKWLDGEPPNGFPGGFPGLRFHVPYVPRIGSRSIIMDSLIEDMVDSNIVVVAAAGNSSATCKKEFEPGYDTELEVNLCYMHKNNPSILFDGESVTRPDLGSVLYSHYSIYGGYNLLWGDNMYNFNPLQGSSPGASSGSICVGSVSYQCCPEKKSSFSNTGSRIDIYAAGDEIPSAYYKNRSCYQTPSDQIDHPEDTSFGIIKLGGTSMASPQVCGAIASYFTDGNVVRSNNLPQQALTWVTGNAISSLTNLPYPYNLSSGTNKQLYYPGITVAYE